VDFNECRLTSRAESRLRVQRKEAAKYFRVNRRADLGVEAKRPPVIASEEGRTPKYREAISSLEAAWHLRYNRRSSLTGREWGVRGCGVIAKRAQIGRCALIRVSDRGLGRANSPLVIHGGLQDVNGRAIRRFSLTFTAQRCLTDQFGYHEPVTLTFGGL
jgi:hypothetical protein